VIKSAAENMPKAAAKQLARKTLIPASILAFVVGMGGLGWMLRQG